MVYMEYEFYIDEILGLFHNDGLSSVFERKLIR